MTKKEKLKVSAIKCPKCGDTIFSRAHHNFYYCSCGGCFIGCLISRKCALGRWDPKYFAPKSFDIEIKVTKEELYEDWNSSINKYGIIKGNGLDKAFTKV